MFGKKRGKVSVQGSKPDLPPFLQRMREQIVADEDNERRLRGERQRKLRPNRPEDPDDDPSIVKLSEGDITEEEYKRMKKSLDTQYKLDSDKKEKSELNVDDLIGNRTKGVINSKLVAEASSERKSSSTSRSTVKPKPTSQKALSYSSSEEED